MERAARGLGLAAVRQPDPRHQPPRGAVRRVRRRPLCAQGAAGAARAPRVDAAAPARGTGAAGRRGGRDRDRPRRRSRRDPDHAPPRVLPALSRAVLRRGDPRSPHASAERARRAARAAAHPWLLLGRLLALERAVPPRRGCALGLPRRRRDGRAARPAVGRAARVRPRHRADEHRRRAARRRRGGRAPARPRSGRDGRGDREAIHVALARADARGDVRPRGAVQARRAAARAERSRLRRRGDPAGGDAERLPAAARPARRRAGAPPAPAASAHRARRAGEPGAAHAERHRALPRGDRAAREATDRGGGRRIAVAAGGVRADGRGRSRGALGGAAGRRGLPPGARAPVVPVGARRQGRRDRRGGPLVRRARAAVAAGRARHPRASRSRS